MNLDRGCRRLSRNWSVKLFLKSVTEKAESGKRVGGLGAEVKREEERKVSRTIKKFLFPFLPPSLPHPHPPSLTFLIPTRSPGHHYTLYLKIQQTALTIPPPPIHSVTSTPPTHPPTHSVTSTPPTHLPTHSVTSTPPTHSSHPPWATHLELLRILTFCHSSNNVIVTINPLLKLLPQAILQELLRTLSDIINVCSGTTL